MQFVSAALGEDVLFFCQEICGNFSRFHADPWIKRYIFPNSVLPSLASLARTAEGFLILEDVSNIGPNYDPTLLAWDIASEGTSHSLISRCAQIELVSRVRGAAQRARGRRMRSHQKSLRNRRPFVAWPSLVGTNLNSKARNDSCTHQP
jgi:hypothetical protein